MKASIKSRRDGDLLFLQICRPEKKNALTAEMYDALARELRNGDKDDDVKVIVLHGTDEFFTSGNDLVGFKDGPSENGYYPHNHFLDVLTTTRKPVIAAVSGYALGIGTITLLHCDLVYATPGTQFSLPFVKLGLSPEGATSYLLPILVGYQRAAEMIMFGDKFSVITAKEIGLVNEIVDSENLLDLAREKANKLAALPQDAILNAKALLKRSMEGSIKEARKHELEVFNERLNSDEFKAEISGFYERRSQGK